MASTRNPGRSAWANPTRSGSSGRTSGLIPPLAVLLAEEFVAVDFETANRQSGASACQVALAKISSGVVVDRFSTLLRPPAEWDQFEFTYLHGISAQDTRESPMWDSVAPRAREFVSGLPVYAHNASFDARVWAQLDKHFNQDSLPQNFFCSYRLGRKLMPNLVNHKLPTLLNACVTGFSLDHHDASSDAEACGLIVAALQRQTSLHPRLYS